MVVLIYGAGNIGRRQAESLLKSKKIKKLIIFDIQINQTDILYKSLKEINYNNIKIEKFNNLKSLLSKNNNFFLVIISSTANARVKIFENIFNRLTVKFWILEKPICNSLEDINILKKYVKFKNIYVNYQRRYQPIYIHLKNLINSSQGNLMLKVSASNIGITCNSYHWIDLMRWFTGDKPLKFLTHNFQKWEKSKRKGFYEVHGNFVLQFKNGSILELTNNKIINDKCVIGNFGKNLKFFINETDNTFLVNNSLISKKKLFQSEMSIMILNDLIKSGDCNLETLSNAIIDHRMLFKELIYNWDKFKFQNKFQNIKQLPIT